MVGQRSQFDFTRRKSKNWIICGREKILKLWKYLPLRYYFFGLCEDISHYDAVGPWFCFFGSWYFFGLWCRRTMVPYVHLVSHGHISKTTPPHLKVCSAAPGKVFDIAVGTDHDLKRTNHTPYPPMQWERAKLKICIHVKLHSITLPQ